MLQGSPVRVGIIGTGVMGGHHTRVASTLPGCDLLGIFDADHARAEAVSNQYGITAYDSLPDLCTHVDAVIVASPTNTHADVAMTCLQAGCHVLVEKPIAASLADAEALVACGKQSDRVLMIGHIERYNPAVSAVMKLLNPQELFTCELQRLSTTLGRDRSVDIIFDLMIHDLDLVLAFTGSKVTDISAMGHRLKGELIDHVTALLRFENGVTATLTASAVSQERVRRASLFTPNAQYTIDLAASREVLVHRFGKSTLAQENGQYFVTSQIEQILVPNREPLAAEQDQFLQAIRTGTPPLTDAESGYQALCLAYAIQAAVNEQLAV